MAELESSRRLDQPGPGKSQGPWSISWGDVSWRSLYLGGLKVDRLLTWSLRLQRLMAKEIEKKGKWDRRKPFYLLGPRLRSHAVSRLPHSVGGDSHRPVPVQGERE